MKDETKKKIKNIFICFVIGIVSAVTVILSILFNNRRAVSGIGKEQQRINDGINELEETSGRIEKIIRRNEEILQKLREQKQDD
jgi:hypothetical protein